MFGTKDTVEADLNKHFSRFEDPLWDEKKENKNYIEIKRTSSKDFSKHAWKIYENSSIVAILESENFTKKQINFLLTVDGLKTLIEIYKQGNNNISKIKKALGEYVKNKG